MRHKLKRKKLNRTSTHRVAMFANMATSLVMNEQIRTTLPKAKALRPYIERLVTSARRKTLHARRLVLSKIRDEFATRKLLSVIADRYESRPGGYTRIVKDGYRVGDMASMAYIEFVDRDVLAKVSRKKEVDDGLKAKRIEQ